MSITNFKRDDGFGAQFQTIIFSIIYADLTGQEFQYSPFEQIAHNYDEDPQFIEKKENLIGVRDIFKINDGYSLPTSGAIYQIVESNLYRLGDCKGFQRLKNYFRFKNNNIFNSLSDDSSNYNISIHFRNVNSQDIGDYGYTDLKVFLNKINEIRSNYIDLGKVPKFHFYSQGKEDQFDLIKSDDIIFHLDESVEDTFSGLAFADELVMSKSSFSYCAGLLSDGVVYYQDFWHRKKPDWVNF